MNVTYEKDRNSKVIFLKKTCEFYAPDLGDLLIGELERELPKLLPDYGREDIERVEQTY